MIRNVILRYGIPALLAISAIAYLGVPSVDRLLSEWFRADVEQRAQSLANTMSDPVTEFLQANDNKALRAYLAKLTADERLLAIVLCRDKQQLMRTELTPTAVNCTTPSTSDTPSRIEELPSGSIAVSEVVVTPEKISPFRIVIVHDVSFVDRRQSTARNYVLAFAGVMASVLALFLGFVSWLLIRRWVKLLVGDIRGLRFLDDAESPSLTSPVLSQVRKVLRELEYNQRLEIDFHENWTPQALQQVVREHLNAPEMIVVSNREPYIHNVGATGPTVQVPASGMVTAMEPIMRACSGTWVAHGSGSADREVVDRHDRLRVPPDEPAYTLRRVWLSPEEEEGFYYGFSNEGLWALCHITYVRPAFREADWRQYQAVNKKFADVVAAESHSDKPVLLIQDFHFSLLPRMLRERKPLATIMLFWHIPWPNVETFGICPWKQELLRSMIAADSLGFHTRYHCQNFLASVDRYIECKIDHERMTVSLQGHVCRVVSYPISIEWPPRWLTHTRVVNATRAAVCERFGIDKNVHLGLGVERWDFTKGILERFHAIEALLERERRYRGRITLIQIAAPSRSKLPAYQTLQTQTLAEVQRINDTFGTDTWRPIVLIDQHQEPEKVFELYRAVDFCLVNSLHDGMNLVAKEFVAARDDEDGVLILSTFTGASYELVEALLINPFDIVETADAIKTAIQMPREERRQRMKLMRRTVKENNIYRWAGRMLMDAAKIRQRQELSKMASTEIN